MKYSLGYLCGFASEHAIPRALPFWVLEMGDFESQIHEGFRQRYELGFEVSKGPEFDLTCLFN